MDRSAGSRTSITVLQQLHMESAVEAGAPAAAVPEDRCRPPPQTSGALLDEATAAANPFPCGSCRAFHNNDSGYCEKCSSSWLSPGFVAWARRLQRRAYLALITLVMSYFETSDRLVLSMFIGSSGLIVLFYLLTQSVATESPTWICGLVAYVAALLYLIPTIRSTVLKVEDIDKISSLFEEATKQSLAGATKDDLRPAPRKLADKLLQPTDDLRQLYVIDYEDGNLCRRCNVTQSQTSWSEDPTIVGVSECFINGACYKGNHSGVDAEWLSYIPGASSSNLRPVESVCQYCDPAKDKNAWSVVDGYTVFPGKNPPDDCRRERTSRAESEESEESDGAVSVITYRFAAALASLVAILLR